MIKSELIKKVNSVVDIVGELPKNWIHFSTDSRSFYDGIFVAITGEKFNAVNFLEEVLKKNCKVIVYSSTAENRQRVHSFAQEYQDVTWVCVEDSIVFLQELAGLQAEEFKKNGGKIIGITGSNGKTTNKEMIYHILDKVFPNKVYKTKHNNNNHIGVPLTILEINPQIELLILELGSNHPGEMKVVCDIAKPQIGITTNIGQTHLEFFENEEAVFHEESYLYQVVKENSNSIFFINNDDSYLAQLEKTPCTRTYGVEKFSDFVFYFHGNEIEIKTKNKQFLIKNESITGEHNRHNLAASFSLCYDLFPQHEDKLIQAASSFKPTANRSQWLKMDESLIFLDAYNANPSSMKLSLKGFFDECRKQQILAREILIIMGDMNELGKKSIEYHEELGSYLNGFELGQALFIGKYSLSYKKNFAGKGKTYPSRSDLTKEEIRGYLSQFRAVFIKGSRSLQLESLLDITK